MPVKEIFSNITTTAHLTVFDGSAVPVEYDLSDYSENIISFGRDDKNDIIILSKFVSRFHGQLRLANGQWIIEDTKSTNGLFFNEEVIKSKVLEDGDSIKIDTKANTGETSVLLVFSQKGDTDWKTFYISDKDEISIGRGKECDIRLDHVSVSRLHARIAVKDGRVFLVDASSKNGVMVNGKRVEGNVELNEKDQVLITNSKLIFTKQRISYCCFKSGISVDAIQIVKTVDKNKVICNGVDLNIKSGEMVAIIGGSGAGKSTVMNCLSGYSQPTKGCVMVNGVDLYENYDTLKNIIGYVPQSDIVFDNLTVCDMLLYAAQLRLPKDIAEEDLYQRINETIRTVELTERRNTLIKNLSGGQRKRASIAVELLSDPNLFFLDEPASGLDPGTERNLMMTLKSMATGGKTVVFVTHSTLNLHLCDKIVFMGAGGNLCFYGSLSSALEFFNLEDVVDVYNMMTTEPMKWRDLYFTTKKQQTQVSKQSADTKKTLKDEWGKQTFVLAKRYMHVLINDRTRLLLIMLQAPLLAFLISFVANGNQFDDYRITKSLLFSLSCSAFWIGILNSIQEICKERNIIRREYMTGMRIDAYIVSKMSVMAIVCAIQSFMLSAVFAMTVGLPDKGVVVGAFFEMWITTFLTALSASATGIFVSALFKNADRAMTVAPLLLMPQLLFSGLIFELSGASKIISYIAACRWSMEGYGTTANLNAMDTITNEGLRLQRDYEAFFEFTISHQLTVWIMLCGFIAVFSVIAGLVLRNLNSERSR
ncbi:MAG: FHA domain-containing protein [Oscillospiraceae bacterium]|nr:FHA domain-containing protein [Oscillospiraceae bacterium]